MIWKDRLQPEIGFVSPGGAEFSAFWRGDPRNMAKKLGIFEFPGIAGVVVQDLDVGATTYSLNFFFEGPNHDLISRKFFEAIKERGSWQIDHPTLGRGRWFLVSITEDIQPVEAANITAFKSEWIEPTEGGPVAAAPQIAAVVRAKAIRLDAVVADQAGDIVDLSKPSLITQFTNKVSEAAVKIKETLGPLTTQVAEINAQMESVHRGLTTALTSATLDVVGLASQVQTMIKLPSLVAGDLLTRLDFYIQLIGDFVDPPEGRPTPVTVNTAAVEEIATVTALVAIAEVAVTGELATREEAIAVIEKVTAVLNSVINGLDYNQEQLDSASIEDQFISQLSSFNDSSLLISAINDLLLRQSFDLAVSRRFTLKKPRTPVEIAFAENQDIDVFISVNNLKSEDILLLPAGREVLVFL